MAKKESIPVPEGIHGPMSEITVSSESEEGERRSREAHHVLQVESPRRGIDEDIAAPEHVL